MKILHTSDWHLGHRFYEHSQLQEQELFLQWLEQIIEEHKIDVLLVSGDVFDVQTPSPKVLEMYYGFLGKIIKIQCKSVVITAGNHDSPNLINAPAQVLKQIDIHVVGKSTDRIEDEVFVVEKENGEGIIVGAAPYLRDRDIRKAVEGEHFEEAEERYKKALVNHYTRLAKACQLLNKNNYPSIAMGHLFAVGGSVSDSEKQIYVGNLGHIGAEDFPDYFNYVALGHLHRPQIVGGNEMIRYSGSPVALSFSELNYTKKVIVLETSQREIKNVKEVEIPEFRVIKRIVGNMEYCEAELQKIEPNKYGLPPFIEVVIDNKKGEKIDTNKLYEHSEGMELIIRLKNTVLVKGIEEWKREVRDIRNFNPVEVFERKCKDMGIDLEEEKEMYNAFMEIYNHVNEQE